MKKKFLVYGWINGDDYEAGKSPNATTTVTTTTEKSAEDIADARFKNKIGKMEAIQCELITK